MFGLATLGICGCSITQTVTPVENMLTNEVCIIENPAVREGFLPELKSVLQSKNAQVRLLSPEATTTDCPVVATYVARWSWDLTIYMSYVEITVFRNGVIAGNALYDATKGGGRLDKFVDSEPKIRELVNELFPSSFPAISVNEGKIDGEGSEFDFEYEDPSKNETKPDKDLYTELIKLDDLRQRGLITDEEYEQEKKELLESN